VLNVGHKGFTKTSRYTQIVVSTCTWGLTHTIALVLGHHKVGTPYKYDFVMFSLIPTIIALAISPIIQHFTGSILMSVAGVHERYAVDLKQAKTLEEKIVIEDRYEAEKAHRYFAFYVFTAAYFNIVCWFTIFEQTYFAYDYKLIFFLNFLATAIIEWFIIDFIRVWIGPGNGEGCLGRLMRRRGFWYDYHLQDKFVQLDIDE
jgi:hypothetical protein